MSPNAKLEKSIPRATADGQTSMRALLRTLTRELFQTEVSALRHCQREAERLGDTAPAEALRAVSRHAASAIQELPSLARRNGLPFSRGGMTAGLAFSELRDKLTDLVIDSERSYRGTLLGCRHGLDVVRTMSLIASRTGNLELDAFCSSWLNTRQVLVERLEEELAWFVAHPDEATQHARPLLPSLRMWRDRAHRPS